MTTSSATAINPHDLDEIEAPKRRVFPKYKAPAALSVPIGLKAKEAAELNRKAKEEQKRWKEIEKETEAVIRESLGGANIGTFMGVTVVKLAYRAPVKVNPEMLKLAFPEAYDTCAYVSEYNFLQVL